MAEIDGPTNLTIKLFERSETLLRFFLDFHEDFDVLRSIFAPHPEQRVPFHKISGQDDIKLAILRDEIVGLVDSLEEVEVGPNGAEKQAFERLVARVEYMIRETTKLRKRFETAAGYKYNVDVPTFKILGNTPGVKRNHVFNTSSLSLSKVEVRVSVADAYNPRSTLSSLKQRQLEEESLSNQRRSVVPLRSRAYSDNEIMAALLVEKKRNIQLRADVETIRLDKEKLEQDLYEEQDIRERLQNDLEWYKAELQGHNGDMNMLPLPMPDVAGETIPSNTRPLPQVSSPSAERSSPSLPDHPLKPTARRGSSSTIAGARRKSRKGLQTGSGLDDSPIEDDDEQSDEDLHMERVGRSTKRSRGTNFSVKRSGRPQNSCYSDSGSATIRDIAY